MFKTAVCFIICILMITPHHKSFSQSRLDSTLKHIRSLPEREQVQSMAKLCWQNREKNTDLALELGLKGIEIAEPANYNKELAQLYGFVGVIYQHYKNQTQKAIPYYDKSLKASFLAKDSIQMGYVYNNLGDAFYKNGNVPQALENAEKSMAIFKKINHLPGIAYSYANLGYVNRIKHDYPKALECFKNAIEIRESIQDSFGIASSTMEIGRTYFEMKDYEPALDYFKRSVDLHIKLDNKNYTAYSYQGMADVYFQKNIFDSALIYYEKALELSTLRDNTADVVNGLLAIALVYGHTEKVVEGEKLLELANEKAQDLNDPKLILEVYKVSAHFYSHLEQYQSASENYQKYIDASDSLFSVFQLQTIEEVKNRFEVMENLNQINEDLGKKQKELIYLFIISVLLAAMVIAVVLRYRITSKLSSALKASNQTKDKILSVVSHDLISPFNTLIGFSKLLSENLKSKNYEEAEAYSNIIYKSSTETLNLTQNLLNWARAQRNVIHLSKKTFDMVQLLNDAMIVLNSQAHSKNITISILPEKPITVQADKDLIKAVLINLTSNAIKFSREKGKIELAIIRSKTEIVVSVKDYGVGIKADELPKLFNENETVQTKGTKNEEGTGLGLLVCKEFVELHKGRIWAESEIEKGSTFYFSLPI